MSALTDLINAYIRRNANQEITGPILNGVLLALAAAAENVPYIGENGDWYLYDAETGQYADSGHSSTLFRDVAVDITEDGGDPSGSAVVSGTTLLLTLANIRGEQGPKGPEGPAGTPGITAASVSVDGTTGTPSVVANIVGTTLEMAFSGLKGADGAAGPSGPAGPQGPQGNPGSSVDYPFTLANNLTTDDATVALTAAQGVVLQGEVDQLETKVDDIDEALDVETTTGEVTERFAVEEHIGYIASYGLVPQAATSNNRYSSPFLLKAGETLTMNGITVSNVYRLASYNPDTEAVTALVLGASANDQPSSIYQSTYTANTDIWLICGWNKKAVFELSRTYEKTTSTSKLDDIDAIADTLEMEIGTSQKVITPTLSSTAAESYAGVAGIVGQILNIATYAAYSKSDFFTLKKGDSVRVQTSGASTVIAVLAFKSGDSVYSAIMGNGSTQDETYTVPLDGEYCVSYYTANGITVTITRTEYSADSDRIDRIEETISGIPAIEEANERILSETESHINDDLTDDIVSGYYIHKDGGISQNASFGYKEYQVKAGAEIEYTAFVHPNFAIIAKKLSNTSYEALVTTDVGYRTESFSYVCQEDMTIAVSFYLDYSRSITIDTELIASNTKNIGILFDKIDAENSDALVQDIDFGVMFNRIAVIGDSLASGRVEGIVGQPDAVGADYYGFSWLNFLSKRWRCYSRMNYSGAGLTTATWISTWLPVLQADPTIYDAYFIALGTNSEYNESDPSGDQANYEAFIERYNDIIDAVRTKAPNAVIFLVSLYEKRAGNTTLEEIAEERMETDKGIYYIDYANTADYLRYSTEVNWRGHFSSDGYAYVASVINQIVNRIVWENKTEEFWQQFAKYHNIDNDFGTTAKRPAASAVGVGFTYYDTTLGKMIMSNGTAWVNLDGTALS